MDSGLTCEPGAAYNAMAQAEGWGGVCDSTLSFRARELENLLAIWRDRAGTAAAPKREDLTPKLLKAYLPHIAIYERVIGESGQRRYRVRLMGTQFAQVMGDMANKFLDETVPPAFLPRWHAALDAVLDGGVALRFYTRSDTANKSFLIGEYLEAPLLDSNGAMTKVFAAGYYTSANDWAVERKEEPLPKRV
jgi:hypothetical protein